MWRVTLKGVLAHRLRYALTALSVLLGVSFIAGTYVLSDTINGTFDRLYNQIYQNTAAVVRASQPFNPGVNFTNQRERIDASLATTVATVPGVRAVALDTEGYAQLIGKNGKVIGRTSNGAPTLGMAWSDVAALNALRVLPGGQPPAADNQVVIDKHSADVGGFKVGDTVRVLTQAGPASYTISGIATWAGADSPLGASITAFMPLTAQRVLGQPGKVDSLMVEAQPGVSQDTIVSRIQAAIRQPGIEVITGHAITSEDQQALHQSLSIISVFLLAFGYIALFVGAFVIFNTFSIIVAQRLRELALLRAVGASRAQVTATVLGESLIIGLIASAAGVVAGIGLAAGLKALLSGIGMDLPAAGLVVTTRTIVVGMAVGTVITVISAIWPARRASRIAPVAALQDVAAAPRRLPVRRAVGGAILLAAGTAVLLTGLFGHFSNRMPVVGAGAVALFIGVAVLSPFVAGPVCRVLGAPLASRGTAGKLGQRSAMRNPSRASATAAALMIGVSLVSLTTVLAASVKTSAHATIDSASRADFVVSSGAVAGGMSGFSPQLARSLSALPQVSDVAAVRGGMVKIYGSVMPVVAADPARAAALFDVGVTAGNLAAMTPAGIAVSTQAASDHNLHLGSPVTLAYPTTGTKSYTVQAIYKVRQLGGDYLLPLAAAQANFPTKLDIQLFVKLASGVTVAAATPAINHVLAAYPTATLMDQNQYKSQYDQQVNQLLNLMYGLLAMSVAIALIGIANTLALSIYERTRELGLLRAVGTTRHQLRSMVRTEALVISTFGALEGLVLGSLLGWAIVVSMRSQGVSHLVFPVQQLLIVTIIAALAGLLAAISPSRRAARLNILRAVTTE
jgi:putative ABC transport system permease protein